MDNNPNGELTMAAGTEGSGGWHEDFEDEARPVELNEGSFFDEEEFDDEFDDIEDEDQEFDDDDDIRCGDESEDNDDT